MFWCGSSPSVLSQHDVNILKEKTLQSAFNLKKQITQIKLNALRHHQLLVVQQLINESNEALSGITKKKVLDIKKINSLNDGKLTLLHAKIEGISVALSKKGYLVFPQDEDRLNLFNSVLKLHFEYEEFIKLHHENKCWIPFGQEGDVMSLMTNSDHQFSLLKINNDFFSLTIINILTTEKKEELERFMQNLSGKIVQYAKLLNPFISSPRVLFPRIVIDPKIYQNMARSSADMPEGSFLFGLSGNPFTDRGEENLGSNEIEGLGLPYLDNQQENNKSKINNLLENLKYGLEEKIDDDNFDLDLLNIQDEDLAQPKSPKIPPYGPEVEV